MSLTSRLALLVALCVTIAVAGVATVARVSAQNELSDSVDEFLRSRADQVATEYLAANGSALSSDRDNNGSGSRRDGGDRLLQTPDAIAQVIDETGRIVDQVDGALDLPVTPADLKRAEDVRPSEIRTITLDGESYRLITRTIGPNRAVQVARSLTANEEALRGLDTRLLLASLLGVGLAAIVGWGVAHRTAKPVRDLAAQASHVARTQQLDATIDLDRSDEVGDLADSFNEMLRALDRSRHQQHRLVQDAGHELRTPLTSVRTNVEVLRRRYDAMDASQRQEILTSLDQEVGALSVLVGELVDLATDASAVPEAHEPLDLAEIAEIVANRFRRSHDRNITVTVTPGASLVVAAAGEVERAVINLVTNAIKFSPAASPIDIAVAADGASRRIEVIDQGPGIPPADLERIFDRFYRSDATRTVSGSGLGLAIVAQTAERHGGTVWARNVSPTGAAVGFSLSPANHAP